MEMSNLFLNVVLFGVVLVSISCTKTEIFESDDSEKKARPWTHLNFKNSEQDFSFAIVSDNSGGSRPGVFQSAVLKLNLLKPDFVMSIGDLIDTKDYNTDTTKINDSIIQGKWIDFKNVISKLDVPFFYVAGNNDIRNNKMKLYWEKEFGALYYSFKYKNTLFIILNSEDLPGNRNGSLGEKQIKWLKKTLVENTSVKWTFIFLHRPIWLYKDQNDWQEIESLIKNRSLTVFAGHHHAYSKSMSGGQNYYGLATTGGASNLEFDKGQFDHFMWISMSNDKPKIGNVLLNGVWGDNPSKE